MSAADPIVAELKEGRRQFLALVDDVRPDLHRYCARMTGSIADGEDVVQDTLARAYYELSELVEMPALRPWLFRIAHNRALDYLRRYERRMSEPLESALDIAEDDAREPESELAHEQAMQAAVTRFLELVPTQRSCVILKDVLGYSLEEIASLLQMGVPAIKAALHRGRERLRALADAQEPAPARRPHSSVLVRYAELFNARDWDGVRAMLVDEARLDLVSRSRRVGRDKVGIYFTNYGRIDGWRLVPGWLDGREVLAVFNDARDARPGYFIELTLADHRVAAIRDFRYVPYVGREAQIELEGGR